MRNSVRVPNSPTGVTNISSGASASARCGANANALSWIIGTVRQMPLRNPGGPQAYPFGVSCMPTVPPVLMTQTRRILGGAVIARVAIACRGEDES